MGSSAGWSSFGKEAFGGWLGLAPGHNYLTDQMTPPDAPTLPDLPPPVEEIDLQAQKDYTKKRLKGRKGRSSTILGSNNRGKTVLG